MPMSKKPTSKGSAGPDFSQLKRLVRFMAKNQLVELEWQHGNDRIYLKNSAAPAPVVMTTAGGMGSPSQTAAALNPTPASQVNTEEKEKTPANHKQVLSPFVGTFYRAPSPDSGPYVQEGQMIKKGAPLCIIEAMKLMNEIESDYSGKIVSILVDNGQPVEFGEPLFVIET